MEELILFLYNSNRVLTGRDRIDKTKDTLDLDFSLLEGDASPNSTINPNSLMNFDQSFHEEERQFINENREKQHHKNIEIGSLLGEGSVEIVYQGRQYSPHREVAIKKLRSDRESYAKVLVDEAMIMGELTHPNIPPIYHLDLDEKGLPEVVMKKIEGKTFEEILGGEPQRDLKLRDALQILIQVCYAVEYAHSQGFLHRDLKPENIMVGQFNQVYLMDWGIAVSLHLPEKFRKGLAGTPAYMAPEMLKGDPTILTKATDVFLLGAILHEIITGEKRHQGETISEALRAVEKCERYRYSSDIPELLAKLCNRACAKNKLERPLTAFEFRENLEEFLDCWEAIKLIKKGKEKLERYRDVWRQEKEEKEINNHLLHQISLQAKFSFEQAMELWNETEEAKKGLFDTLELMIEQNLHQKKFHKVILLFEEYPDLFQEKPALVKRFDEATVFWTEELTKQEELAIMEKELDPSLTLDSRISLQRAFLGSFLCSGILLSGWNYIDPTIDAKHLFYSFILTCAPIWLVTIFLFRPLIVNRFGKQTVRIILSGTISIAFSRYICWQIDAKIFQLVILDSLILSLTMSNASPVLQNGSRLGIFALIVIVGCFYFPDYSLLFQNVQFLFLGVVIAHEWRRSSD